MFSHFELVARDHEVVLVTYSVLILDITRRFYYKLGPSGYERGLSIHFSLFFFLLSFPCARLLADEKYILWRIARGRGSACVAHTKTRQAHACEMEDLHRRKRRREKKKGEKKL